MNYFMVLSGKKIKRIFLLALVCIFGIGVYYAEAKDLPVFFSKQAPDKEPAAIYSVKTDKKVVALTFDISWGEERTAPILDVLQKKGVKKATFFLSSPWAETHPDLVKKIGDELKFEIGSHGHKHDNYSQLSEDQIRKQITTSDTILNKVTGKKMNLIRYPNGDFDKRVLKVAQSLGYTSIQWDTDSRDWMNPGVKAIIDRVVTKAHPGDIILLHASDSCRQTHEALPQIIDQLRSKGYEFVTVSELVSSTQQKVKPVQ
ncbi:polysaccharide deacetylase family sporulation protein PdaB [Thermoactinomyces sp. DSM 45891]|uniref:polysaccharide deacetylase family sporulation protein PdaB n=1 Tax=Thermoactinomyces sp. DSM 45891 TaxID=1761907 RepID=UPI00091260CD|nr:polysaccharide deacetylase family sporulation protein PdaB [Thermoactinomyces sp. DSM 45891]SFX37505.1 polysaccharide deacetylase family sporulation protein PdaB [Thermoactinomyces sp. DSM 45891]